MQNTRDDRRGRSKNGGLSGRGKLSERGLEPGFLSSNRKRSVSPETAHTTHLLAMEWTRSDFTGLAWRRVLRTAAICFMATQGGNRTEELNCLLQSSGGANVCLLTVVLPSIAQQSPSHSVPSSSAADCKSMSFIHSVAGGGGGEIQKVGSGACCVIGPTKPLAALVIDRIPKLSVLVQIQNTVRTVYRAEDSPTGNSDMNTGYQARHPNSQLQTNSRNIAQCGFPIGLGT